MSNIIVMVFSPRNIVGCLLKKRLTKGRGGSRTPQDPPRYALACVMVFNTLRRVLLNYRFRAVAKRFLKAIFRG